MLGDRGDTSQQTDAADSRKVALKQATNRTFAGDTRRQCTVRGRQERGGSQRNTREKERERVREREKTRDSRRMPKMAYLCWHSNIQ